MKVCFYFNDCNDKLVSSSDKNIFWKSAFLVNEFYNLMRAFVLFNWKYLFCTLIANRFLTYTCF